jgi:hypothetical protein
VIEHRASDPAADALRSPIRSREAARQGPHIGPLRITPLVILLALGFIGSAGYIAYVVLAIDEEQIPLLAAGFVVLGVCFAVTALAALVGMWRAASRAAGGRALGLAILGGIAGMAAIGCFTVTALSAMLWNT